MGDNLQNNSVERPRRVLEVLSDFQFIGSAEKGESADSQSAIKTQDVPDEFEVGTDYLWLKKGYADNQQIFRTLQDRLRAKGVTIVSANALSNRFMGGLAFSISFQDGPYIGTLFNRLDPRAVKSKRLHRQWGFDDYILKFEKVP